MNLLDSSGWLAFFDGGANAPRFESVIADSPRLLVPTLCLAEVFKRMLRTQGEEKAMQAVVRMGQGRLVDLDAELAVESARLGLEYKLALADSIIFATARRFQATLWTQDQDFKSLPGVRYLPSR